MYFDDFKTGDTFEIKEVQIKREKMLDFAADYDPQQIYMDEEFGKASKLGDTMVTDTTTETILERRR